MSRSVPSSPCPGSPGHRPGVGSARWLGALRLPACQRRHLPQKEEYHTHLALLYLDEVLQQRPGANSKGAEATETQAKLRHLLQKSDLYRVHFLIGEQHPASLSLTCSPWQARMKALP